MMYRLLRFLNLPDLHKFVGISNICDNLALKGFLLPAYQGVRNVCFRKLWRALLS